ncbi:hypothetical protein NDU88_006072 [Pleurodeles waltl]|uniref:Uncharacterized protein n=1 Tax=Pleurodeles waltl TaxID=8319 RepID=A0AAV7VNK7_PLEWA|nr:hypothetical protein NDU88_006072 [Pleurodeles waltl]
MTAPRMRRIYTPGQKSRPGVGGAENPAFAPLFNAWVRAGGDLLTRLTMTCCWYEKDMLRNGKVQSDRSQLLMKRKRTLAGKSAAGYHEKTQWVRQYW